MKASEQINELADAMSRFQGSVSDPAKDGKGRFGSYVPLDTVLETLRGTLPQHGLSFVQMVEGDSGIAQVTTRIMHTSGQWLEATVGAVPEGNKGTTTIQAVGGTVTYLRRYALMSAFGLTGDNDNDGDPAPRQPREQAAPPPQRKQAPPSANDLNWMSKIAPKAAPPAAMPDDWPHYGDGSPVPENALDYYAAFVAERGDAPKAHRHLQNWYKKRQEEAAEQPAAQPALVTADGGGAAYND